MTRFLGGFALPLLLLTAGLLNWSLISLINVVASLLFCYTASKRGLRLRGRVLSLWFLLMFSVLVIVLQVILLIVWAILDSQRIFADVWWIKLIGFMKVQSSSPTVIYFLIVEILVALVAFIEIRGKKFDVLESRDSCWGYFSSVVGHIGYRLRLASCLVLPAVQLVVGISNPSWLSLPFFICSCVGLVDWSLTSNFLGLFRWWKLLFVYAGFSTCVLYTYQLPIGFLQNFHAIAKFVGLYKISAKSNWQQTCSGISLVVFFYMVLQN